MRSPPPASSRPWLRTRHHTDLVCVTAAFSEGRGEGPTPRIPPPTLVLEVPHAARLQGDANSHGSLITHPRTDGRHGHEHHAACFRDEGRLRRPFRRARGGLRRAGRERR